MENPRPRDRSRSRSRSRTHTHRSHRHRHTHSHSRSRSRSRSPAHRSHRHHSPRRPSHHKRPRTPLPPPAPLPFNAPPLSKHALSTPHVRAIFSDYLDIQKGLHLAALPTRELKGRYKRFVSHYNRGELARGWYERVVKEQHSPAAAAAAAAEVEGKGKKPAPAPAPAAAEQEQEEEEEEEEEEESSEDEVVGPFLPGQEPSKRRKLGAARPTFEDLELQKADAHAADTDARAAARHARTTERKARAALLDELAPRADAGTFARRLEKRADHSARQQRGGSPDADAEVDDAALLGGEGGTEGFKQKKAALERKKNDRELRKEQLLQARIAEREERMAMHRVKEERTMAMLRALAGRFQ